MCSESRLPVKLKSQSFRVAVTDDHGYVPFVTIPSFLSSFMTYHRHFKTSNTTIATSRGEVLSLLEQLKSSPVFNEVLVAQSFLCSALLTIVCLFHGDARGEK
jgi:hypothetical protein